MSPLVSIICLCHNHGRFIREALNSVINQTYNNIEIIIVDDASSDNSTSIINEYVKIHPEFKFLALKKNAGNCTAFNKGLSLAKGEFVIDFATDDVLTKERVGLQVEIFKKLDKFYGVVFTNAIYINEHSEFLGYHYKMSKTSNIQPRMDKKEIERGKYQTPARQRPMAGGSNIRQPVPSGNVYKEILERYFICPPTMMIRKRVLDELEGYDEQLAYEDFDFWVRSARNYKYYYLDKALTYRRIVSDSHSVKFNKAGNDRMIRSTYLVCKKAFELNRNEIENKTLAKRVKYEMRLAFFTENFDITQDFAILLKKLNYLDWFHRIIDLLSKIKIRVSYLYKWYYRLRYGK
ncbi:MAG: glycosyltransferase [Cytophagales bacterium]|nr:glycosyltransferase [Cytophagales bacterium]